MARIHPLPSPALEVRDLRLVAALTRTGTTKAAGEILHLAQPSVSRALLSLEDRIGVLLFDRTPQGLVATAMGDRLAKRGTELLLELRELEHSVRHPGKTLERIRLVSECHTAYHWLPTTLQSLREELPGAELSLRIEHTHDPLGALESGAVDAALLTSPLKSSRTLLVEPLFADEMVFVLAPTHALARKRRLTPNDLCANKLLTAPATPADQRWFTSSVFGRARPTLQVTWVPLTEAIVDLARAGMGIGVLTEWVAKPYIDRGDVVAKRLSKKQLRRPWQLAWRRELGEVGPQLLRALKACELPS